MKLQTKIALVLGALALATAPAMALASQPPGNGPEYTPAAEKTPGPSATPPEKAKAYGVYCQGQSKKHVAGEKGTPFSQCVTAMAKAANNEKLSPGQACKGMSKKHVKGEKGTPFSRCVKAAAKLRKDQQG
jgi:invasion protein IalB